MGQLPEVFGMDDNVNISKELQETRLVGLWPGGGQSYRDRGGSLLLPCYCFASPNHDRQADKDNSSNLSLPPPSSFPFPPSLPPSCSTPSC